MYQHSVSGITLLIFEAHFAASEGRKYEKKKREKSRTNVNKLSIVAIQTPNINFNFIASIPRAKQMCCI